MGGKHRSKKRNVIKQKRKNRPEIQSNNGAHKFEVDERVLCYEPDKNKARVLYEAKVLEVVERVQKGKTSVEYKIHFFGWNSSWDRYVTEDCVLKNTDQNKQLQMDLRAKAEALLGDNVKKKKRKKTLSELLKEVTKDKNAKSDGKKGDGDDSSNSSGSSDSSGEEESDEEDKVVSRIILTDKMKAILEQDYFNIMTKNMLVKVPAEFSVICVFEGYVKFTGFRELRKMVEQHKVYFTTTGQQQIVASASTSSFSVSGANTKTLNQAKTLNDAWAEDIARIYRKVRQAQEIVHGLKVIFDYMLYQMLLYDVENEQYKTHKRMRPKMPDINWLRRWFNEFKAYFSGFCSSMLVPRLPVPGSVTLKEDAKKKDQKKGDHETPSTSKAARAAAGTSKEHHSETLNKLRKHSKAAGDEKERKSDRKTKAGDASSLSTNLFDYVAWTRAINKYSSELQAWEMLPEDCYRQESPDPCMVYGLIHVLRFFVKLPDILNRMLIPRRKVRIIANHVNQMIDHIQTAYAFSVSRLYVPIPRQVYEEDQIRIAAPPPEEKQVEVKVEVERDFSQYSTRNYQNIPLVKARPQLPKVVEVPLSTTETLEEHQLTINSEIPLPIPIPPEDSIEEIQQVVVATPTPKVPAKAAPKQKEQPSVSKKPEKAEKPVTVAEKLKQDIKKEPISPPIQPEKPTNTQPQSKKKPAAKPTVSPPVQPMVRQVRKSAAHAAFKNAHLFVSQQHLTARTIAASASSAAAAAANAVVKQEPGEQEQASASTSSSSSSRKRSLPSDAPVSAPKRVTRTSDVKPHISLNESGSSASKSFTNQSRKSRQEQRSSNDKHDRRESDKKSSSKSPQGRRPSSSPVRKSRNSEGNHPSNSKSTAARRTSSGSSAPRSSTDRKRNKSRGEDEVEKKYVPPTDRVEPKVEPRRISSPRPSKSGRDAGGSKDNRCPMNKTPQKSVSPTSTNTIRLRSRSDERQLRSKGALINALSLPMQSTTSRSSSYTRSVNSEAEKSPKRRESTGNKDTDPPFKRGQQKRN